ncbi:MAG: hypothetical protein Q9160_008166 [Pyrenula sp. 1 TL-2023]
MLSTEERQPLAARRPSATPPQATLPSLTDERKAASSTATLNSSIAQPRAEPFTALQKGVSDVSRTSATDSLLVESTPPPISSAISSQAITQPSQYRSQAPEPETQAWPFHAEWRVENSATPDLSSKPSPTRLTHRDSLLAGHKRTANGDTKESEPINTIQHQNDTAAPFHFRTSSNLSNGNMLEVESSVPCSISHPKPLQLTPLVHTKLSQQLRTRLSYAMVKVQNGWTTHTLDEVKSLASQHGSPRSINTSSHTFSPQRPTFPHHHSPHTNPANGANAHLAREWSASSAGTGSAESSASSSDPTTTTLNPRQVQPQTTTAPSRPTLAPPADIHSSTSSSSHHNRNRRRRPPPNPVHLPHPPPSTPPSRSRPRIQTAHRTPSQNAAMEADAIETLLFMSSPARGSSKYYGGSGSGGGSAQTSPLRSAFSTQQSQQQGGQRKRVGWAEDKYGDVDVEKVSDSEGRGGASRSSQESNGGGIIDGGSGGGVGNGRVKGSGEQAKRLVRAEEGGEVVL